MEERITLDGRLDEPVWMQAAAAADFVQIDPENGMPATVPTEVRIAFDGHALYIGVTCFDSEPDRWLGYETRRDRFRAAHNLTINTDFAQTEVDQRWVNLHW